MMKWVFSSLIFLGVVFGVITGRVKEVSIAVMEQSENAIKLIISLMGTICLWGGIMKIAEESKLTDKISTVLYPITRFLFRGLHKDSRALQTISMNITANLLGLGNAATPLGLKAMRELEKEEKSTKYATKNMIIFVVMNTASIQLLPTTIGILRYKAGSQTPLDILPSVWITSIISVVSGLLVVWLFSIISKRNR